MDNRLKIITILILILFSLKSYSNVGGATMKPGLIGDPIVWELTNISVIKEQLFFKFYEESDKKYCSFTAIYYLQSDTNRIIPVSGIFYGLRANNIQIYFNDNQIDNNSIDSTNFEMIDDLIFRETQKRNHHAVWMAWKDLLKTGFKFDYNPQKENILKVTGKIALEPTQIWYGITTSAIYTKHPFLNKSVSKGDETFHYLITPIETWKSVGEIEIFTEYPENWNVSFGRLTEKSKRNENNTEKIEFSFTDSIPQIFSMNVKKSKQLFYVGGGNLGFHRIGKDDFSTRIGWEFGFYHGVLVNTMVVLDYETNFSDYHQFCVTAMPSTPWLSLIWPSFGAGIGVPIRLVDKNVYTGVRLRTDFSWGLFNISLNWDYIPKLNIDNRKTNYYGVTF